MGDDGGFAAGVAVAASAAGNGSSDGLAFAVLPSRLFKSFLRLRCDGRYTSGRSGCGSGRLCKGSTPCKLERELNQILSLASDDALPADVHRNGAPSPASPDLTPTRAPIIPTVVPATAPAPARPAPTRTAPGDGASKTQTRANTCRRQARTAPPPTTSAPGYSRATSAPATTPTGTAPAAAPSTSSEPALDADAMKATAAAEPDPRRSVGGNERRS